MIRTSPNCGNCDVCLSRRSPEYTEAEFETLAARAKELVKEPLFPEELIFRLGGNLETTKKVVRWLMDNKKLLLRIDNKLEWNP